MQSSFTTIAAAVLAIMVAPIAADSCNKGGMYCGTSLLNKGNYGEHIVQVLTNEGKSTDQTTIQNSLFSCGSGGDISYLDYCSKGCSGVGSTDPDACLT